uniref:PKD domain-containing protein n=1 Tax=candidate division WOR-3 bacterium TaxID=2052148 RepID=A0A7V0Z5N3_UNCW3
MSKVKSIFVVIICITILCLCCKSNKSPDIPAIPIGPDSGDVDNHTFFSFTIDPDGDSISIKFDWGDGEESNWSPFVGSGDTVSMAHFYEKIGSYEIRAKAKDIHNSESDWSEPHLFIIGSAFSWSKEYGGSGDEFGYGLQKSPDNSYVVVGSTNSYGAGGNDVYLIKIDTLGNSVWEKTYGGSGDDAGYSVKCTSDGGYIIAGTTKSFGDEDGDIYLLKIDNSGNLLWQKVYGDSSVEYGYDLAITENGYVITGMTGSSGAGLGDVWLLKTDFNGDTIWTKTIGNAELDCGNSIQVTKDNGYIITGYTFASGNGDVYLIKTDANGNILWTRAYGGSGFDSGDMVKQTLNNGYIIIGGDGNIYILKIDASGNPVWEKTYGSNYTDHGYAVEILPDNKYVATGYVTVNTADVYYIIIDGKGNLIKEKTYGDYNYEYGRGIVIDGDYCIISGYKRINLWKHNVYAMKIKI